MRLHGYFRSPTTTGFASPIRTTRTTQAVRSRE